MVTCKDSFGHLKFLIVEILLGKARFGVFVELGADQAGSRLPRTSLTLRIHLDLLNILIWLKLDCDLDLAVAVIDLM